MRYTCFKCGYTVEAEQGQVYFCPNCGGRFQNPNIAKHTESIVYEPASPWRRWSARTFDWVLGALLTGALVGIFAPEALGYAVVFSLPASLGIEALEYTLFGGTFGKWVFSVKVLDASGNALSHSEYGKRLLPIYALGLGLGIPLVCVIPQIIQYVHLRNTGKTFYDEKEGRIVVQYKQGILKCIVCVAFILLVIGLKAYATGLETGNAGM